MEFWKSSLTNMEVADLHSLAKNAESRIGSHVAGGFPVDAYVEKQRNLLTLIQNELESRN
ncbi:hypothetical protein ACQKML_08105 [Peribacillus frigoritolerans]